MSRLGHILWLPRVITDDETNSLHRREDIRSCHESPLPATLELSRGAEAICYFASSALERATTNERAGQTAALAAQPTAATLVACQYCIDLGSRVAHRLGFERRRTLALPSYRNSALFSEHLSNTQGVKLTHLNALENLRSLLNNQLSTITPNRKGNHR